MDAPIQCFVRLDNSASVELAHHPDAVPRPAWQAWMRNILIDHADDPQLITVIA